MSKTVDTFIALLRSAMTETRENIDLSDVNYEALFSLSKHHDLAHIIYYELNRRNAFPKEEILSKFRYQYDLAILRHARRVLALTAIKNIFEHEQIQFVLLKGSVLMELYPDPWMRTSSDIDVLIHRDDLSRATKALVANGFHKEGDIQFHDVLFHYQNVHLELHHNIMENNDALDGVLSKVWNYIEKDDTCCTKMVESFFVFHQFAHTAYHFTHGGCGFRPFVDMCVLEQHGYNHDDVRSLCQQAHIEDFFDCALKIVKICFDNQELDYNSKDVLDYIFKIGEFASLDSIDALKTGNKNRIKQIIDYVFIPYKQLVVIYPAAKHKVLIPVFQIRRWLSKLFLQKKDVRH